MRCVVMAATSGMEAGMAVMGSIVVGVRTAMDVWVGMAVLVVGPIVRPPGPIGTGQDKAHTG